MLGSPLSRLEPYAPIALCDHLAAGQLFVSRNTKLPRFHTAVGPQCAAGGDEMRTHLLATTAAAALLPATSAQASRIFQEQPCRRTNGSRPFGLPEAARLRATAVLASAALNLAARIAIPVIVLNGVTGVASAQTWNGPGADWNTATNWTNPATVPGPNGTATFAGALPTSISMAGGVAVGTLQFNAPNYTFDLPFGGTTINGRASSPVSQMRRRSMY